MDDIVERIDREQAEKLIVLGIERQWVDRGARHEQLRHEPTYSAQQERGAEEPREQPGAHPRAQSRTIVIAASV